MVMFQGRPLARLCALNPDSPAASTAFTADAHFVPANLPVGRQNNVVPSHSQPQN